MSEQTQSHMTPVGRMVQGNPFAANDKDQKGRPLTDSKGQPRVNFFFAIAIAKDNPEFPAFYSLMQQAAQIGFPAGNYNNAGFAWKLADGDHADNINKPGFAGHWVLKCSNGFQPKVFNTGAKSEITDPNMLKRGYFIRALVSIKGNNCFDDKAGLYVNPSAVEFCGYGEEIVGGPDGSEFANNALTYTPNGMSATPVMSANGAAQMGANMQQQPVMQQQQQPVMQQQQQPVMQQQPVVNVAQPVLNQQQPVQQQQQQVITPANDFLNVQQ